MDLQNLNFRIRERSEESLSLPLSAFSTYNFLKNCNSLLTSQSPDSGRQYILNPDLQLRLPMKENDEKLFHLSTNYLSNTTVSKYSPSVNCEIDSHQSSPPYSSLYDSSSIRRQRGEKRPIPNEQKDDRYYERRRRNNQAAKKSRDARKFREDQIALRATILEHENAILRAQLLTVREEASSLRQMLLQKKSIEIISRDPQLFIA